ncbi:FAD/NAD(P)-binding protein [Novosphingobium sp. KCTC 2891]|uniref:FAD/NAD(P)-binding protein n=1 Tax=Novosphingobium sp. KCTC 2891 TaxID=2989730 RepID=UPI0022219068|nr:FAD/NAD(P)-binding protein [Novosphingobium sp. KCTC 2891]MCW1383570.1 FAD/NAD(P)-binding protein [Novosphingobium sp. KCTC 2891]
MSSVAVSSPEPPVISDLPVIIIGAGFSGTLLAINLVRQGQAVVLVERDQAGLAKGLAFGTARPEHLLNVRAANMSAFPDDPAHFLRWMGFSTNDQAHRFVPRLAYGQYLRSLLLDALGRAGRLLRICTGHAIDVLIGNAVQSVVLADGRHIHGRSVVLAQGNLPPRLPAPLAGLPPALAVADPWQPGAIDGLAPDAPVLLVGTGLSAVDVILSLDRAGHRGVIHALSRRGLRPRSHDVAVVPIRRVPCPAQLGSALVRSVRQRAREVGWRVAVDELRPHTRALWQAHDTAGQARILRHLRPWWDVHRHRLAPTVAARIAGLEREGRLRFLGGRLRSAEPAAGGLSVIWRPRGTGQDEVLEVARAIACVGPEGDIAQGPDRLLRRLLERGMARSDTHRLGLDVDSAWRVRDAAGTPHRALHAVGPLTRGAAWEIVAVPDIRHQVWDLARVLAATQAAPRHCHRSTV